MILLFFCRSSDHCFIFVTLFKTSGSYLTALSERICWRIFNVACSSFEYLSHPPALAAHLSRCAHCSVCIFFLEPVSWEDSCSQLCGATTHLLPTVVQLWRSLTRLPTFSQHGTPFKLVQSPEPLVCFNIMHLSRHGSPTCAGLLDDQPI